jgi:sulfite reductase alpha subunit
VINTFLDDIHRPALPYKFKFKFSGCPNDCMNSIQRSDMAVIGTWRDNMRTDEGLARKWFDAHGMNELVNNVIARCPTKTIMLKEIKDVARATRSPASRSATPTRWRSTTPTACAACTAST